MAKSIFAVSKIWLFSIFCILLGIHLNTDLIQNFIYSILHAKTPPPEILISESELKLYNGVDRPEIYLSILGLVYDVSAGKENYGPGKRYNNFVAKDASRSFVTGKVNENESNDEVLDFSDEDCRSLNYWVKFYKNHYFYKGKLVGRFFDKNGNPTPYRKEIKRKILEAERKERIESDIKRRFPPCNVEWTKERGSHVWCSIMSGGIMRDWSGKPRKMFETGRKNVRCACVDDDNLNLGIFEEYEVCNESGEHCYILEDK